MLFAEIKAGKYSMDPSDWGHISESAKDLVRRILVVDPARRITAAQILQHPWVLADTSALPNVHMGKTMAQMKTFVARKRWHKALNTVRSTIKMKMMLASSAARRARAAGHDDDAVAAAFFSAASSVELRPSVEARSRAAHDYPDSYLGVQKRKEKSHFKIAALAGNASAMQDRDALQVRRPGRA
jgi:serine/threonine protein kinase